MRKYVSLTAVGVLALSVSAFAGGRPAAQQMQLNGEVLTPLSTTSGGVAQEGLAAAIYRSTGCGFQSWIGGQPAWYDEMVFFNDGMAGAPIRSYGALVCYDTCHRGGRCIGGGGASDCDCLSCDKLPFDATFQLYDGDPCGAGTAIAGTQGTVTITTDDIPCDQIGDGSSNCFTLTVNVDPKVQVPHGVWIEANYGIDDSWALTGRPNDAEGQGTSPLSGLDDGTVCSTFCDIGGPTCSNDPDRCDWLRATADANAATLFTLQPTSSSGGGVVTGNEITITKGGQSVLLDVTVTDWVSPNIKAWQAGIDSSGYTSASQGTLTASTVDCAGGQGDCDAAYGGTNASICNPDGVCAAGFTDASRTDYLFNGATELKACDLSTPDYRCASTLLVGEVASPGRDSYLWTLSVDVSAAARGTFTVDLVLPPGSALLDTGNQFLPLIGVVPGLITVPLGSCCTDFGKACEDDLTTNECASAGGAFNAGGTCADNPCDITGACCDALAAGGSCEDLVSEADCGAAGNVTWTSQSTCAAAGCNEATGACCVDGICRDDIAQSQCASDLWAKGTTCEDPIIADPCELLAGVPTVSEWGVAIMALLLLAGAKVYFGRRNAVQA